ncbi:hypothetical protein U2F10_06860 [Leptothoe sp. EHU-05/26/07-4]
MTSLFVPGRLCLFGEHSDWAGTYRTINPDIEKGYALVVGTNQGSYASIKHHPQDLIFQATLNDGSQCAPIRLPMQPTPSLCGRMDQVCAFGNKPILMTFDRAQVNLEALPIQKTLFLVIVDLGGSNKYPKNPGRFK